MSLSRASDQLLTSLSWGQKTMSGEAWLVDSRDSAEAFCQFVMDQMREDTPRLYSIKRATRSVKQNNALHLCSVR